MKPDPLAVLDGIPAEHVPAAIARLAARAMQLAPRAEPDGGRLLTPEDVAKRLRTHKRWVYRHADELGAVLLSERALRFTEAGIAAYVARQRAGR